MTVLALFYFRSCININLCVIEFFLEVIHKHIEKGTYSTIDAAALIDRIASVNDQCHSRCNKKYCKESLAL